MDKKRFYEYKRQIHKLQEKDNQTTLRVQTELNRMDDQEKRKDKKMRAEILAIKQYEVELLPDCHSVMINFYNDETEQSTHITLDGEYFEKEMYENKGFDPADVYSRGKENIFSGDNENAWEDYEVAEIFHNNIMKFDIQIENY